MDLEGTHVGIVAQRGNEQAQELARDLIDLLEAWSVSVTLDAATGQLLDHESDAVEQLATRRPARQSRRRWDAPLCGTGGRLAADARRRPRRRSAFSVPVGPSRRPPFSRRLCRTYAERGARYPTVERDRLRPTAVTGRSDQW
ncbi:MAG: hypothetical protein U5K37_11495 [Natrialbaceae archaeon]|nr:hypothetical protein [Natrialbaceae archaeon]